MPPDCENLKSEYNHIETLSQEFDSALENSVKTGDFQKPDELKKEIEQRISSLREKLWPFETLKKEQLKEQYEAQKNALQNSNILEKLSTGELGIKAIDGQEYPIPQYEQMLQKLKENKEILKTKEKQGFSQLLIVPFGLKLDDLTEKYKQVLLNHKRQNKLFAAQKDPNDPLIPLELDENEPVWVWSDYQNADGTGKLIYHPKEYSQNHQGQTKQQLLQKTGQGFNILLIENLPNIPRENKGQTVNNRPQIEAGKSPNEYLELIKQNPAYEHESGLTPEDWLTYAILHLEKTNQVIDDYEGNGSISYQLGSYFPASGRVPRASWLRGARRALLAWVVPGRRASRCGARAGVRV